MKNLPLVSWHCLTYDRPHLLPELLYCFISQTYPNRELIIINDQPNIEYYCDISGVKIYNLDKRFKSLGAKRNYAMSKCSGDFVLITDDDDLYYPEHTEHLIKEHLGNIQFDIVKDFYSEYSVNNKIVNKMDNTTMGFSRCCIKREFIDNNKFNEDLNCYEDSDYMKNAETYYIVNNKAYSQYRWGMDTYHVSGLGNKEQGEIWEIIENDLTRNNNIQEIKLEPKGVENYR